MYVMPLYVCMDSNEHVLSSRMYSYILERRKVFVCSELSCLQAGSKTSCKQTKCSHT